MAQPCSPGGTCTLQPGINTRFPEYEYSCTCNSGYEKVTLEHNEETCQGEMIHWSIKISFSLDVDECTTGADNCSPNADCTNLGGSFSCACKQGYTGDGTSCSDVDECTLNTHNCAAQATCTNIGGSFTCACNSGYTGDGVTCTDVDECTANTHNCHAEATCSNSDGGFTCACNAGYTGGIGIVLRFRSTFENSSKFPW